MTLRCRVQKISVSTVSLIVIQGKRGGLGHDRIEIEDKV